MNAALYFSLLMLANPIMNCELNQANDETKCYNSQFEKGKPIKLKKYGTKLDLALIKGALYKDTFINMPKTKELTIRSSGIAAIEDGFLQNLPELETLTIKLNHQFPNMTKKLFQNCCAKLRIFRVYDNSIKFFEKDFFTIMRNLEEIWIEKQKISLITAEYFVGLSKLQLLGIQNCHVRDIQPDAFDSLASLKKLAFPGNHVRAFRRGVFKRLARLEDLQFPHNEIRNVTGEEFAGLKNLRRVDLTGNKMQTFDLASALANAPRLEHVRLKFHAVGCDYVTAFADVARAKNVDVSNLNDQVKEFCKV